MRVIVSDTSCVIDLHKAGLLEEFVCLRASIVFPEPLFDDEALSLTKAEKNRLIKLGLQVKSLPGDQVGRAGQYYNRYRQLKIHDCFALIVAEDTDKSVLLTGDKRLKAIAQQHGVKSHGVLWATDQIHDQQLCTRGKLRQAMRTFLADPFVYVPDRLIQTRIDHKYR